MKSELGARLAQLRRQIRMSQVELSRLSGVSRETVSTTERGVYRPRPETVELLARGLATSVDGDFDATRFSEYHVALFKAAGYLAPSTSEQADAPLTPEERLVEVMKRYPKMPVLLAQVGDLEHEDVDFVEDAIEAALEVVRKRKARLGEG